MHFPSFNSVYSPSNPFAFDSPQTHCIPSLVCPKTPCISRPSIFLVFLKHTCTPRGAQKTYAVCLQTSHLPICCKTPCFSPHSIAFDSPVKSLRIRLFPSTHCVFHSFALKFPLFADYNDSPLPFVYSRSGILHVCLIQWVFRLIAEGTHSSTISLRVRFPSTHCVPSLVCSKTPCFCCDETPCISPHSIALLAVKSLRFRFPSTHCIPSLVCPKTPCVSRPSIFLVLIRPQSLLHSLALKSFAFTRT